MPQLSESPLQAVPATDTQRNNVPPSLRGKALNSPFAVGALLRLAAVALLLVALWLAVLWATA
jgi:hypothetical protein